MRHTQLTADEVQAAEKAADDRRKSRNQGFAKMHERDQAVQLLSNGAVMLWHVDKEDNKTAGTITMKDGSKREITTYPPPIPEDKFGLILDGKRYLFDLDEFRKWLRWA